MKYSNSKIGETTGILWNILDSKGSLSLTALIKESKLTRDEVLLSLGWLFKENKITTYAIESKINFKLK